MTWVFELVQEILNAWFVLRWPYAADRPYIARSKIIITEQIGDDRNLMVCGMRSMLPDGTDFGIMHL